MERQRSVMRCPYCGGQNQDRAIFCGNCGRDLRRAPQNVQPPRSPAPAPQQPAARPNQQGHHAPAAPVQPPRPAPAAASFPTSSAARRRLAATPEPELVPLTPPAPPVPAPTPEPEAPGPFPPRTMAQFEALREAGRQPYTVSSSEVENGRKIVCIVYPRCASWQQAATLLQALREQQEERYKTTIIRGFLSQQPVSYAFTNGQLQYDRDVLLGSQRCPRYIVETANGYAADSVRFVLNES